MVNIDDIPHLNHYPSLYLHQVDLTEQEKQLIGNYINRVFPFEEVRLRESYHTWLSISGNVPVNTNLIGLLGEVVVVKYLGRSIEEYLVKRPTYKSDLGFDIILNGLRYDVKTARRIRKPEPFYSHNVSVIKSGVDGYIFVDMCPECFYVDGKISKEGFIQKSKFHKKGDTQEGNHNGFIYPSDQYEIRLHQLDKFVPDTEA